MMHKITAEWRGEAGVEIITESPFLIGMRYGRYPYLAADENEFLLVLFIKPRTGVVLCSAKADAGYIGEYRRDWIEDEFYPVNTVLTIIQEEVTT